MGLRWVYARLSEHGLCVQLIADMLTERAVLPRPEYVTTLLKLPPGQAATTIIAASTLAG